VSSPGWAVTCLAVALAVYALAVLALIAAGRRTQARALVGIVPDCAVLLRRLAREGSISRPRRLVLVACAGYVLFPLDPVPDFIPVAGQLDDAIVVVLVLRAVLRASGREMVREHWPGPESSLRFLTAAASL
jgi:uncharacterized membrane protein YkvA (DUF1232 family)